MYCNVLYCADLPTIVTIVTCYEGKQQPDCVNCVARLRSVSGSGVQGVTLNYVRSTGCHTLLCEVYFVHSYELEDPQILCKGLWTVAMDNFFRAEALNTPCCRQKQK